MREAIRSYTSLEPVEGRGRGGWWREFRSLARGVRAGVEHVGEDARRQIEQCGIARDLYEKETGVALKGARLLEVGSGQMLAAARVFAVDNTVVATDLDVFASGWNPAAYLRIWRRNGFKRMLKTIGRKALARDRSFLNALRREMGVDRLPDPEAIQMDATRMTFADDSFDLAYSYSVFEHLPDPGAVWREQRRVVKPGGCVFTHLHLHTSDSGGHDLRVITRDRAGVAYWAHLRPAHAATVQNSAYLNRLRLADWLELIEREQPGAKISFIRDDEYRSELNRLRAEGELSEYGDDELLIRHILIFWRKPASLRARRGP